MGGHAAVHYSFHDVFPTWFVRGLVRGFQERFEWLPTAIIPLSRGGSQPQYCWSTNRIIFTTGITAGRHAPERHTAEGQITCEAMAINGSLGTLASPYPVIPSEERIDSRQTLVTWRGNDYVVTPISAAAKINVAQRLDATQFDIVAVDGTVQDRHQRAADSLGAIIAGLRACDRVEPVSYDRIQHTQTTTPQVSHLAGNRGPGCLHPAVWNTRNHAGTGGKFLGRL